MVMYELMRIRTVAMLYDCIKFVSYTLCILYNHNTHTEKNRPSCLFVCLFDWIYYVPSTIFQLNRDGSSCVEPVLS